MRIYRYPPPPLLGALTLRPRHVFLQPRPRDQDRNNAGASDVEGGGDVRRDDLYACGVRTKIQSVIDSFSSNFCFLAEVLRKVAGD